MFSNVKDSSAVLYLKVACNRYPFAALHRFRTWSE